MSNPVLKKMSDLQISIEDPWADDILDRKRFGKMLANLVEGVSQPFVVSLKGEWGSGKSIFLRRFMAELETRAPRIPTIFVDAWKYDYYEDPLYALVSAVETAISEHERSRGETGNVMGIAKPMFGATAKLIAPLAKIAGASVDLLTSGSVSTLADGIGELGDALFKANAEKRDAHAELRKRLLEARNYLLGLDRDQIQRSPGSQKVVVIIDELDRCRPDYAIRLLERIKHFFDLPGYLFLIAVDGENIHAAVRTLYGQSVDGERYLRKFFDLELYLPTPDTIQFNKLLRRSFNVMDGSGHDEGDWDGIIEKLGSPEGVARAQLRSYSMIESSAYFEHMAAAFNMRLRDQSQAFARLYAAVAAMGDRTTFMPVAAALIVCLRYHDYAAYEAWRTSGVLPDAEDCVRRISKQSTLVASMIKSYLEVARLQNHQELAHWSNHEGSIASIAPQIRHRLPRRVASWPDIFRSSHEDVFALARLIPDP